MIIHPANGDKFESEELYKLLMNTMKDILKREYKLCCDIICEDTSQNIIGIKIQIKKYESINDMDYILLDLNINSNKIILDPYSKMRLGPIIIEPDDAGIAARSISNIIVNVQEQCRKNLDSDIVLTCNITNDDYKNGNEINGSIQSVTGVSKKIIDIMQYNDTKYMEIKFILDKPRQSKVLYVYTYKIDIIDTLFYAIGAIGNKNASIIPYEEDFKSALDTRIDEVYDSFKQLSDDPRIKIEYMCIAY